MDQGLYQASMALGRGFRAQEIHAENLAHANTPGYRRRMVAERSFANHLARARASAASGGSFPYLTDSRVFEPGLLKPTGSAYDVGLEGPGFLAVQARAETLYTRSGVLTVAPDGSLVTSEGFAVLGQGAPILLNPRGGRPSIDEGGRVSQDGAFRGRLRLAEFDHPSYLTSAGSLYFRAAPGTAPREATTTRVRQGYREGSNVDMMEEMIGLITTFRRFEAAQKTIQTIDRTLDQLIRTRT